MSRSNGLAVVTATPEMAKQMPKVFKTGATYVVQRASAVALGVGSVGSTRTKASSTRKKATKKKKVTRKKATKKKVTRKKASKKTAKKKVAKKTPRKKASKKTATKRSTAKKIPKATRRKPVKPEIIIGFVKNNEGCNMTDIEGATRLPQATIRRVLNSARETGEIRTEGQRRGLRYYAAAPAPAMATAGADSSDS